MWFWFFVQSFVTKCVSTDQRLNSEIGREESPWESSRSLSKYSQPSYTCTRWLEGGGGRNVETNENRSEDSESRKVDGWRQTGTSGSIRFPFWFWYIKKTSYSPTDHLPHYYISGLLLFSCVVLGLMSVMSEPNTHYDYRSRVDPRTRVEVSVSCDSPFTVLLFLVEESYQIFCVNKSSEVWIHFTL